MCVECDILQMEMDTRRDGPRQVWTKTGCLSTFPKPSQKGAVTPWLAGRGMPQAAFTYSLAPSHHTLRTGDLNPLMQNITIHSHTTICLYSLANMFFFFFFFFGPMRVWLQLPFTAIAQNPTNEAQLTWSMQCRHIISSSDMSCIFVSPRSVPPQLSPQTSDWRFIFSAPSDLEPAICSTKHQRQVKKRDASTATKESQ